MSVEFEAVEKEGRCCLTIHLPQHSHKKRKDSLKTRAVLLMFLVELEISRVAVQGIHQNISVFSEDFLSRDNFEDVLAIFCFYDYGATASEAVE